MEEHVPHKANNNHEEEIHRVVVLFYKYFLLREWSAQLLLSPTKDSQPYHEETEPQEPQQPPTNDPLLSHLVEFQESLGKKLKLKGRILLSTEGVNGTLSAPSDDIMNAYIQEMEQFDLHSYMNESSTISTTSSLSSKEDGYIFRNIDWKKSHVKQNVATNIQAPFPDFRVSVKKEIVSSGGKINASELKEFGGTHLTPEQFHNLLSNPPLKNDDDKHLVLIDVRNTYEYEIGRFQDGNHQDAINPHMPNFASFDDTFCAKYAHEFRDKQVVLYCTGGVRCEKASVMLRKRGVPNVSQLSGGIHRYLERYGSHGFFKGKNFVFDRRMTHNNDDDYNNDDDIQTIGTCVECFQPFDEMCGSRICTVCKDLVLVCPDCQTLLREYHCARHSHWKQCYFTFLDFYSLEQLHQQHSDLTQWHSKESSKKIRKTLMKQMEKVQAQIHSIQYGKTIPNPLAPRRCRSCFLSMDDNECDGLCWGFWKGVGEGAI